MGRPTKYKIGLEKRVEKKKEKASQEEINKLKVEEEIKEKMSKYTPEQVAKMVADFSKRDPFRYKGLDPRFRYRFINRAPDRLDRQTMRGWEIVTGQEAEKIASENKVTTRQGQIQVGDSVLAKIPFEVYLAVKKNLDDLNRRMIKTHSNALKRDMGRKYSRNVEEDLKIRDKGAREEKVI